MSDELTLVAMARDWAEAALMQGVLQNEGIQCIKLGDEAGGLQPNLVFTEGIHILYRKSDADRAHQILEEITTESDSS